MLINVIILSIVEGITEFLPVSSTGHLIIVSEWLKMDKTFAATFDVAIQLGAILAVLFLFPNYFKEFLNPKKIISERSKIILVAIFPALLLGFFFRDMIKQYLFTSETVFIALIIGGVALIAADLAFKKRTIDHTDNKESVSLKQAIIIGLFQCAALWPGMSRSGSTIIGGLVAGANVTTAASFSFIIAVPVMVAAVGYDLLKSYHELSLNQMGWVLVGMILSFLVAYASMRWFLGFIQKQGLYLFGIYRIILGGAGLFIF